MNNILGKTMIDQEYCPILQPDEIINTSIMGGKLAIIVEGRNDFPIYDDLFKDKGIDSEIYIAEELYFENKQVKSRTGGCYYVIHTIDTICKNSNLSINILKRHILGVVDLDMRKYRNEIPTNELIFTLDRYSIENHFVNIKSCKFLVHSYTNAPKSYLNDEWIDKYFENIKNTIVNDIFLIVVEAIRNAILPKDSYEKKGIIKFEPDSLECYLKNPLITEFLEHEKVAIETFHTEQKIQKKWEDMLISCKGKWLLNYFIKLVKYDIDNNRFTSLCTEYNAKYASQKHRFKANRKLNLNDAINSLKNNVSLIDGLDRLFEKIAQVISESASSTSPEGCK